MGIEKVNKKAFDCGRAFRAGMDYAMKRRGFALDDWVTLKDKQGEYYHVDLPGENPNKASKKKPIYEFGLYSVRKNGDKYEVVRDGKVVRETSSESFAKEFAKSEHQSGMNKSAYRDAVSRKKETNSKPAIRSYIEEAKELASKRLPDYGKLTSFAGKSPENWTLYELATTLNDEKEDVQNMGKKALEDVANGADVYKKTAEVINYKRDGKRPVTAEFLKQQSEQYYKDFKPKDTATAKTPETKPAEKHEPSVQVAKPTDLDTKQIERAYAWRSFDPEKKAERIQKEYSNSVNNLYREMSQLAKTDVQKKYLENQFKIEQERILNKYKDAIYADERTASAAVTGGANFNYSKNSDRLDIARRKWDDAYDQFRKAKERLTKGIQDAGKTKEQKQEEYIGRKVAGYKERLNAPFDKELFYSRLKTEAKYGNVEVVNRVMEEVKNSNKFTSRHRIFKLPEYAQRMRAYRDANKKD